MMTRSAFAIQDIRSLGSGMVCVNLIWGWIRINRVITA